MNRRVVLLNLMAAVGMAAAGCSSPPPPPPAPPVLNLTIIGGADQNPDAEGRASPVAVRVYQLTGTGKFQQTDVFALKDNEAKTLGPEAAAASQEFLISPADKTEVKIDLKPNVSAVGIAVLYSDIDHATWRSTMPANAHGPTTISASVGKSALTMK